MRKIAWITSIAILFTCMAQINIAAVDTLEGFEENFLYGSVDKAESYWDISAGEGHADFSSDSNAEFYGFTNTTGAKTASIYRKDFNTCGEDFMLESEAYTAYNFFYMYFLREDAKNYYYLSYGGDNADNQKQISIYKVSDGTEKEIGSYEHSAKLPAYKKIRIFYEKDGRLTVRAIMAASRAGLSDGDWKTVLTLSTEDGVEANGSGTVGVGAKWAPYAVYQLAVKKIPKVNFESGFDSDSAKIDSDVVLKFSDDMEEMSSLTDDHLKIYEGEEQVDSAKYTAAFMDSRTVKIAFKRGLHYETEYKIELSDKFYLSGEDYGLPNTKTLCFETEGKPFWTEVQDGKVILHNRYFDAGEEVTVILVNRSIDNRPEVYQASVTLSGEDTPYEDENINNDTEVYILDAKTMKNKFPPVTYEGADKGKAAEVINEETGIKVYGVSASAEKGKTISIKVLDSVGNICAFEQTKTDEGGGYSVSVPMMTGNTGNYTYTYFVGGDDYAEDMSKSFLYLSKSDRDDYVKKINAAAESEIRDYVVESIELFVKSNSALSDKVISDIAASLWDALESGEHFSETDGGNEYTKYLREQMIVSLYNNGEKEKLFDSDNKADKGYNIDFEVMDKESGFDLNNIFENKLSSDVRKKIINYLMQPQYKNEDEIYQRFAEGVVLYAVKYSNENINALLKKYAKFIGIDIQAYSNLSNTDSIDELLRAGGEYASVKFLQQKLDSLLGDLDPALYSYVFSPMDAENSQWEISHTKNTETYTDDGITSSDTGVLTAKSPVRAAGDYRLSMKAYKQYNNFVIRFDWTDEKNYYECKVTPSTMILSLVKDGETTELKAAELPISTDKTEENIIIDVSKEKGISASLNDGIREYKIITEYIDSSCDFSGGYFLCILENTPGYIKSVELLNYLTVLSANQKIAPDETIELTLNFAAEVIANDRLTLVNMASMEECEMEIAAISGKTVSLKPKNVLWYDTEYKVVISCGAMNISGSKYGFRNDQEIVVTTERGKSYISDMMINGSEISTLSDNGISLKEYKGQKIDLSFKIEGMTSAADVYVLLSNGNGATAIVKEIKNTALSSEITAEIEIPVSIDDNAKMYILSTEANKVNPVYPSQNKVAVADGKYSYTIDDTTVQITGTAEPGQLMVAKITSPDASAVEAIGYAICGNDGSFSMAMNIKREDLTDKKCKLGVSNCYNYDEEFVLGSMNSVSRAISVLNDNKKQSADTISSAETKIGNIKRILENPNDIFGLTKSNSDNSSEIFDHISKEKLAKMLYECDDVFSSSDIAHVKNTIEVLAILTAMNQRMDNLIFDGDKNLISAQTLHFADESMYKAYLDELTDEGRDNVSDSLLGQDFLNLNTFKKKFAEQLILNGICYYKKSGSGHIFGLLKRFGNDGGFDIDKFLSVGENAQNRFCNSLSTSSLMTASVLQQKLNAIAEEKEPPKGSGGTEVLSGVSAGPVNRMPTASEGAVQNTGGATPTGEERFTDLNGHLWAKEAILYLADKNVISGYGDGTFRPETYITREEFVKMAVMAFELKPVYADMKFDDVKPGEWYYPYVSTAYDLGIVNGISEKAFGVGQRITREDVCVILARILDDTETDDTADELNFDDAAEISDYAVSGINSMVKRGAIHGMGDGTVAPKNSCTRAEVSKILCTLVKSVRGEL